jgi:apolipoprotein N-acyltransferase
VRAEARLLRPLAAAAGGLLVAASMPPDGLPELAFVAFAPLIAAVRGVPWRTALRLGLLGGFCLNAGALWWVIGTLQVFAELPLAAAVPLFALLCLWTAAPVGLWAAGLSFWTGRRGEPLVAALLFTGIWWTWPVMFPFTPALGLAARPAYIQGAELGGAALVELTALLCSALLVAAFVGPARRRAAVLAALLPAAAGGLGALRIASLDAETVRVVRVGLIQPNIPLLWDDRQARLARLREPSAAAQAAGAALIVWPENLYPWPLGRPFRRDTGDDDRILGRHALPTIFGAGNIADDEPFGYNSAFLMAADGQVQGRFDKVLLVPLGERIPLVDPEWAKRQVVGMAHNFAGDGPARFVAVPGPPEAPQPPVSLGPLICYEDIFDWFARDVAAQPGGVEMFVNLTNDTWYGYTSEPARHLALAQFRSVEHRVPMVRSVNSGPSSLIDRAGRVVATTELRRAGVDTPAEFLVVDVELGRDTAAAPTPYARGGWLLLHLCRLVALALVVVGLRRR